MLSVILTPVNFTVLALELKLRPRDFAAVFWRPTLACLVMAGAVLGLESFMLGGLVRLAVSILVGAFAYCATIMTLWKLIGCPDGPEKTLWHLLRRTGGVTLSAELESGAGVLHQSKVQEPLSPSSD